MRLSASFTVRITQWALLAVVLLCPYAIPVPWRFIADLMGYNDAAVFLEDPVTNQVWFTVFGTATAGLLLAGFGSAMQLRLNSVVIATILWFSWSLVSISWAGPFIPVAQAFLLQSACLLVFIISSIAGFRPRALLTIFAFMATLSMPLAGLAILQAYGHDPLPYSSVVKGTEQAIQGKQIVASTFGHPNYMGSYFAPVAVCCIAVFASAQTLKLRALGLTAAILIVVALFMGGTRGPLISALAGAGVFALLVNRVSRINCRIWLILPLVLLALGTAALSSNVFRLSDRLFATKEIASRAFYWLIGLEMWKSNPVMGVGFAQFDQRFWSQVLVSPQAQPGGPWHFALTSVVRGVNPGFLHNDHLQILVETGVIGALLWIVLWALFAREIWHRSYQSSDKSFLVANAAVGGSVTALLADASFAFPFRLPCSALLIWFLIGTWASWNRSPST